LIDYITERPEPDGTVTLIVTGKEKRIVIRRIDKARLSDVLSVLYQLDVDGKEPKDNGTSSALVHGEGQEPKAVKLRFSDRGDHFEGVEIPTN